MSAQKPAPESFRQIAVVGTGLMGSSFALAARESGLAEFLVGVDTKTEALDEALRLGIIDQAQNLDDALGEADCVIVSTPPESIEAIVRRIAEKCREGTLVMDFSSVKETTLEEIDEYCPLSLHFVSVHPMAGNEKSGPGAARADLFRGEPLILVPSISTRPEALERADALWRHLGAKVYQALPARHDELVTGASHLPQLIAFALASTLEELYPDIKEIYQISGPGLRDMLRCSRSQPELWEEILKLNGANTQAALGILIDHLGAFQKALIKAEEEEKPLKTLLEKGHNAGNALTASGGN